MSNFEDDSLIECNQNFWIWNLIQYAFFQILAIIITIKLRKVLSKLNYLTILLYSLLLLMRTVVISFEYFKFGHGNEYDIQNITTNLLKKYQYA